MIVSRQNRRVKDIRRLRRCKGNRALLEGRHLLTAASEVGLKVEYVLATTAYLRSAEGIHLVEILGDTPIEPVAEEILEWVSDTDSPRGAVGVAALERGGVETLPLRSEGVYLYVDSLQDPGNLGALVRSAEAFGVSGVALAPGSVHPSHPRALRASAGSLLRVPVAIGVEAPALTRHLEPIAARWAALTPRGGISIEDAEVDGTLILAIGAEGPGVSAQIDRMADVRVTLPIDPRVESLNATVAASIALYELSRSR